MKLKEGFILKQVADKYVVVAVGPAAKNFNGMITLNESGAILFEVARENADENAFKTALMEKYSGLSEEVALKDAKAFLQKLMEEKLLK